MLYNDILTDRTRRCQKPPKDGEAATINFHLTPHNNNSSLKRTSSPLKHVALSEITKDGTLTLTLNPKP